LGVEFVHEKTFRDLGLLWCNGVLADQKTEALTLFLLVIGGNIY
jgi:hypothetical protein